MNDPHPFTERNYHFSGVGGSGMAPMAQLTALLGARVTGSDRNFDRGLTLPVFDALAEAGVTLVPQDGSGVVPGLDALIHSSAVEQSNPDFARAQALGITRIRRGSFLAKLAAERRAIAIAGTSGKSTVTAMVAHILVDAGFDPSFLGGGAAASLDGAFPPGSLRVGGSDWFVVETDESDGSVAEFSPAIATLTNLTRDHKEMDVTTGLFARLLEQTRERAVLHVGDPALAAVPRPDRLPFLTVAVEGDPVWIHADLVARSVRLEPGAVWFEIGGTEINVPFPGILTVQNAALAIATAHAAGISVGRAARSLESFAGVRRRLERIGSADGIEVFDDFAHNPVKIRMAIEALRPRGALWIFYQPHGYGPTRFFRDELIETFREALRPEDRLLLAPIYDAGGTADRTIRSEHIADPLADAGISARVVSTRDEAARQIVAGTRRGDRVVVMGARDDTLPSFARAIQVALAARTGEPAAGRTQR
ncbi:MAG: UDP-N-acetylmuramate--alanine ligase [Candidatus Eisenbacteria bacterium]|uniref:UDP-N-acetylmuramate--alanine ligase n=1 Tax=Eiseniibacteriota bacterium TaxID=2212470 RepID=A0A538T6K9_UNCEI|nr:MAG: UDP-N-acetylmuramate--alanine ligase [Candidatus Eisenbacteria bacterium]